MKFHFYYCHCITGADDMEQTFEMTMARQHLLMYKFYCKMITPKGFEVGGETVRLFSTQCKGILFNITVTQFILKGKNDNRYNSKNIYTIKFFFFQGMV